MANRELQGPMDTLGRSKDGSEQTTPLEARQTFVVLSNYGYTHVLDSMDPRLIRLRVRMSTDHSTM